MTRAWLWTQVAAAWLPVWALFTVLMMDVHGLAFGVASIGSLQLIVAAALLAYPVYRFARRHPWPHPFRAGFALRHVAGAALYAAGWIAVVSVIRSAMVGQLVVAVGPGLTPFLVMGVWLYLIVAGVIYANEAARRAGELEAHAAKAQLAALRAQLHPHFLFNALHTVVQLIPVDPRGAARAAEELGAALRTTVDEERDIVTLAEEWAFVERYLAIESMRFGDRLVVRHRIDEEAFEARLPSFALQTLVENAVIHGASAAEGGTLVTIAALAEGTTLSVTVSDDGAGPAGAPAERGTGLRRLRERLRGLYGDRASLACKPLEPKGFEALLVVPQEDHG
ncbi:MAG TPA: histidine kinase [Usitatibacter sp.]|nr:histidine kinase [Usitatibacter sp.]